MISLLVPVDGVYPVAQTRPLFRGAFVAPVVATVSSVR